MKISAVRIKNYRTIRNDIAFDVPSLLSIVGPNNAGKSNIARAIEIFFRGRSGSGYDPRSDLPYGVNKEKTSITVSFKPEEGDWDKEFSRLHEELRNLHENKPKKDELITLNLYMNERNPVYQFFTNSQRPKDPKENARYSRIQNDLIERIFEHFQVYYVPSAKNFNDIFSEFIFPELKQEINPIVEKIVPDINLVLSTASNSINGYLSHAGLTDISTDISISDASLGSLISKIDFMISDNINTEISRKGTGIQATATFAALRWIDERKRADDKEVLWVIEEPESYLHPELTRTVNALLRDISEKSTVILTTHALAFVPTGVENIIGCEKSQGYTSLSRFSNFSDATYKIRKSIGVRFSDFYSLSSINVAVEGRSDRSIFEAVLHHMLEIGSFTHDDFPHLLMAKFVTYSGIKDLADFVKVTYEFVSKECVFLSIFDGDEAGNKHRTMIQQYLSKRQPPIPFESNRDFISVRQGYSIEGLFPDRIISLLRSESPKYFSSYSEDAFGNVEPFQIVDSEKGKAQNRMLELLISNSNADDFVRFATVFRAMEAALAKMYEAFRPYQETSGKGGNVARGR